MNNILFIVKECFRDCFKSRKTPMSDHENFMKLMQWGSYSDVTRDLNKHS